MGAMNWMLPGHTMAVMVADSPIKHGHQPNWLFMGLFLAAVLVTRLSVVLWSALKKRRRVSGNYKHR